MLIRAAVLIAASSLAHAETAGYRSPDGTLYPARPGVVAVLPGGARVSGEALGVGSWTLISVPGGAGDTALAGFVHAGVDYAAPVFTGLDGGPVVPTRDVLVGLDPSAAGRAALAASIDAEARGLGLRADVSAPWAAFDLYRVRTDASRGDDVLTLATRIAALPGVKFAEPDMLFTGRSSLIPNDPLFSTVWGIRNTGQSGGLPDADMDGDEAWDTTIGDASILTVVIDVGVQQDHPDINQVAGFDATGQGTGGDPGNACDNHGTAVAGCVSAKINNALGTVGIAPGTRIASARTFISNLSCNGSWSSSASWTVSSINFATLIGARVTNNSNYYGFSSSSIESAYATTKAAGMVHFASAGNDGVSSSTYPASLPTVNSIGAINRYGGKASFSNYGADIFVTAPGQDVLTTDRTGSDGWVAGDYVSASGTSFASPYTAGVAALVLSVNPSLSAAEVEDILASTADDYGVTGRDNTFGWGVVNARAAVDAARCEVDLAAPFGLLDLADIVAFVTLFGQNDPRVDFAPPAGVFDLADIIAFATGFQSGCP
ncbi:MAG: S8 family serine peptidase [Phycisphaeraceae bacterium]|nr:MAG: S8 family serine peptidase [Phycisphaeraceae bacterium]